MRIDGHAAEPTVSATPTFTDVNLAPHRPGAADEPPCVIYPSGDVSLVEWVAQRHGELADRLPHVGAVLFRGFDVVDAATLEAVIRSFGAELFTASGEHPREHVADGVFTPVFFAPDRKLLWHNENSFDRVGPGRIWFCCVRPADHGGATPIVDSRRVLTTLPDEIRDAFAARGVQYRRTFHPGVGRSWQDIFKTKERDEVAEICRAEGTDFDWRGDVLRTRSNRPAVIAHPETGEQCWFTQAQHWHPACLDPETRTSLTAIFGADLPRDCRFGDEGPIPDAWMATIMDVYASLECTFPWQRGDVLLLDNVVMAHGRNPYRGERKLLVAMSDATDFVDGRDPGAAPTGEARHGRK